MPPHFQNLLVCFAYMQTRCVHLRHHVFIGSVRMYPKRFLMQPVNTAFFWPSLHQDPQVRSASPPPVAEALVCRVLRKSMVKIFLNPRPSCLTALACTLPPTFACMPVHLRLDCSACRRLPRHPICRGLNLYPSAFFAHVVPDRTFSPLKGGMRASMTYAWNPELPFNTYLYYRSF